VAVMFDLTHALYATRDTHVHPLLSTKIAHHTALFVFTTKEAAEKFATDDPYVSGGIVTKSTISEWTVAIGSN
jgi:hypothetical protein